MKSKIMTFQYLVTYATCDIECVKIFSKTFLKPQDDDVSAWYCPICVRSLPFSDLRTKELEIFLPSNTIEHTKTTKSSEKTE